MHGSVETGLVQSYIDGLTQSASSATNMLRHNGDRLEAVEKALNVLEDNP